MELEQRVKTLEYEMKILKNEIQRTLLDIQEQILVHYYPALRADGTEASEGLIQAMDALRAKQGTGPTAPVAKPAPTDDTTAQPLEQAGTARPLNSAQQAIAPAAPEPPLPVVKKVTLDAVRAARAGTTGAPQAAEPAGLPKLVEWAMATATKIGGERLKRILTVLSARNIITPDMATVLLQIAALNQASAPENIPVNKILDELLVLDRLLARPGDAEEALALIEEANLG